MTPHLSEVRLLLFIVLFSGWMGANGQMISAASPAYFSRLNCYSKNFVDVFSMTANPAATVQLKVPGIGVAAEKRFMISELNQLLLIGVLPTDLGGFGFQLNYFSAGVYSDMEPSVVYAKQLGTIDLGIKFHYRIVSIQGYGNTSSIAPEIGSLWHPTEKLHAGLKIYYPLPFKGTKDSSEYFAYAFGTGLGYEVSPSVFIGCSIEKQEYRSGEITAGIHYQFATQFFARIAISTPDAQLRIGAGWSWNSLRVDVTASWHLQLGVSPGFMFIYQPRKK